MLATGSEDQTIRLWDVARFGKISDSKDATPLETEQPIREMTGTNHMIWSLRSTSQGRRLASGGFDGVVSIWDPKTGRRRQQLRGHSNSVAALAFVPDTSRLLSGSYDSTIRIWKSAGPPSPSVAPLQSMEGPRNYASSVSWLPDGQLFAIGKMNAVELRSVKTGKTVRQIPLPDRVVFTKFAPDGKRFSAISGNRVLIWNIESFAKPVILPHPQARRLAWSPDSEKLVSVGYDRFGRLWDTKTGKAIGATHEMSLSLSGVTFLKDGKHFVTSTGTYKDWRRPTRMDVWSAEDCSHEFKLGDRLVETKELHLLPDGNVMTSGPDGARVWSIDEKKEIAQIGQSGALTATDLSHDGAKYVVLGDSRGNLSVIDRLTNRKIADFDGHTGNIFSVEISPDGSALLTASKDGSVNVWRMPKGDRKPPNSNPLAARVLQWSDVTPLMMKPDRELVIDSVVNAHDQVWWATWHPEGHLIASGGSSGSVKLWDAATLKEIKTFDTKGSGSLVSHGTFSPDGKWLAACNSGWTVYVWNVDTGELKHTFKTQKAFLRKVACSPDGTKLASGGSDYSLRNLARNSTVSREQADSRLSLLDAFEPDFQATRPLKVTEQLIAKQCE